MDLITCDICVIGAGSGGLSVAAGAAQMGARTILIERGAMGGDCLNTGCVPSKALIAAAHAAHTVLEAGRFGVVAAPPTVDFAAVMDHVKGTIAAIAPHDSQERFESLGVKVIRAEARFVGPTEVEAGGDRIAARRFVVATGSRAALPPVKGLAEAKPLTNESIFGLKELPRHLLIIGGGPIGLELAQSFRRLGSEVTVIERLAILPRDEPEAAALLRERLGAEGVRLLEQAEISEVRRAGETVEIAMAVKGATSVVSGSHLLVAAGRVPNIEGLGLEAASIAFTPRGIAVDAGLRSSNRRVFAIGDVAGGPQFTHTAAQHAGIVIRSAMFGLPAKISYAALPWVTYTDPEVAHVGLTEAEARKAGHHIQVLHQPLSGNDRAQAEGETKGFAKIVLGPGGKILGATLVGPHAGELIGLWCLAIGRRIPLSAVAGMVLPYPTLAELSKRAAGSYYTPKLFSERTKSFVGFIQRWLP